MATRLNRPVVREVTTLRGQEMIVTLTDAGLVMREKRKRLALLIPYGSAWQRAAELEADRARREKAAKRKAGRR